MLIPGQTPMKDFIDTAELRFDQLRELVVIPPDQNDAPIKSTEIVEMIAKGKVSHVPDRVALFYYGVPVGNHVRVHVLH